MSEAQAALGAAAAAGQFGEQVSQSQSSSMGPSRPATISTHLQHVRQLIEIARMIIQEDASRRQGSGCEWLREASEGNG
jgi:hypothetical protein